MRLGKDESGRFSDDVSVAFFFFGEDSGVMEVPDSTFFLAGATVPGSRSVQIVLTSLFFVLMSVASWRGYWRGPVRQLAPLCSFVVAAAAAYLFGAGFGHAWLGLLGVPWILRGICGVALLCLFVWLPVFSYFWYKGRGQVSEKTGDPEYPVLGAVVGCWTGIFWSVLISLCLVATGAVGETFLAIRPGAEKSLTGRVLYGAAVAKNSMAIYPGLKFLETWSPLPESVFRIVRKAVEVLGSRQAQHRLLEMPEIRSLVTDPAVYPVLSDPEIQMMIKRKDVDALLSDFRVQRMIYDEAFQKRLASLELEPLLDYALIGSAGH